MRQAAMLLSAKKLKIKNLKLQHFSFSTVVESPIYLPRVVRKSLIKNKGKEGGKKDRKRKKKEMKKG